MESLQEQGREITIRDNRMLVLDDPDRLWLVVEGRMDVFSLGVENGAPAGYREHLFTISTGGAIWGFRVEPMGQPITLVATGQHGTRLVELSCPDTAERSLSGLVEAWVRSVTEGIANPIRPKTWRELEQSEDFQIPAGEQALCRQGILWVRPVQGRVAFRGPEGFDAPLGPGFFPVTGSGCLLALEDAVLEVHGALTLLAEGGPLAVVDRFNTVVLSMIAARREHRQKLERLRAGERAARDNRLMRLSVQRLAEVMRPPRDGRGAPDSAENPLLSACRMVGRAGGMEIRAPRTLPPDLRAIARASGVKIRQVVLKGRWWRTDSGPLLGFHEEGDRPVALLPVSRTRYRLISGDGGAEEVVDAHVAAGLKPFAWSFYRPFRARQVRAQELLRFGLEGLWRSDVASLFLAGILGGLLGLVGPVAVGLIFNSVIPQAERGQLLQIGLFLLVSAAAGFLFQVTRAVSMLRIESRMTLSLQAAVLDRLLSLPLPFFRKYTSGDLATRAIGINTIRRVLSGVTIESIFSGVFSLFSLALLFHYSGYLAVRAVLVTLVSVGVTLLAGWLGACYQREIAETTGRLNGLVLQVIGGVAKFRVSGAEKRAYHLWAREFALSRRLQFGRESVSNSFAAWNALYPVAASMLMFALAASGRSGALTVGGFLAFNTAFTNFSASMLALSGAFIGALEALPLYRRIRPILETEPEVNEQKADPGDLRGEIEVSHIRFRYAPDSPIVLDDVSLDIRPGEFVALVGPSGSGKSSLLRLLLGFETAESGAVYYDGQDITTLDLGAVRSQVGVVLQNGRVMAGDIFSNIIGSSTELTVQDAWEAAELSGLAADIRAMPMGMYTIISEGGTTLSGGQRQRLLIARAIVTKPRIVFFDEATSALDNRTQDIVTRSLQRLKATRIVIAHRLSTVVDADRIVVLSRGKIVQEGRYEELLEREGVFAELARRQLA